MNTSTLQQPTHMADLLCTFMVLCKGISDGRPHWAYMAIKPSMARAFREASQAGNLDLDDFGTVLESGEGEAPPSEVKERMYERFGMRDDYEDTLIAAIEAQKNLV